MNIILFILAVILAIFVLPIRTIQSSECCVVKSNYFEERITSRLNTNAYRGWAMIIIMMCHVTGEWAFKPFTPLGGIGVAMFLFLSGFGLSESYKKNGLDNFWHKKLLRIVLPYALFRIVCVMIQGSINWGRLLLDISCWESAYWYIDYIVRCYIVFYVANKFLWKHKWVIFGAFALYTFLGMGAIRAEQALSFFAGILCSDYVGKVNGWSKKKLLAIMLAMGVVGVGCLVTKQLPAVRELFDTYYYYAVELGIKLPLGIAMMVGLYLLPQRVRKSQLLAFCGTYSLELYLVHMYVVPRVVGDSWLQAIAALIISGLVAYSFNKATSRLSSYEFN